MKKMKRSYIFVAALFALMLTSCNSYRYCATSFKSNVPDDIPLVMPYVDVFAVVKGEEGYSDSLSNAASDVLTAVLDDNRAQFPFSDFIQIDDADFDRLVGREAAALAIEGQKYAADVSVITLPDSLRKLMEDNDLPYLMLLYEDGFKRVNANIAGELALSAGIAVLSALLTGGMGYVIYNPGDPYGTAFTLLVADRDRNALAYYNHVRGECDPTERASVFKLLHRLFKKFPGR